MLLLAVLRSIDVMSPAGIREMKNTDGTLIAAALVVEENPRSV
jgi:hypothetical protein